ncbi:MAG: hypothetical protein ACP5OU_04955 [Methanothrix sp.]
MKRGIINKPLKRIDRLRNQVKEYELLIPKPFQNRMFFNEEYL